MPRKVKRGKGTPAEKRSEDNASKEADSCPSPQAARQGRAEGAGGRDHRRSEGGQAELSTDRREAQGLIAHRQREGTEGEHQPASWQKAGRAGRPVSAMAARPAKRGRPRRIAAPVAMKARRAAAAAAPWARGPDRPDDRAERRLPGRLP